MKVGDRVRIVSLHSRHLGRVGEITRISPDYFLGDSKIYRPLHGENSPLYKREMKPRFFVDVCLTMCYNITYGKTTHKF